MYELYEEEANAEAEMQGWSDQMIRDAMERIRRERSKEETGFLMALAEVENREESAGTMGWPRDVDCMDDSEVGEHRQKLSDDEESRAMQDESESEDCHPVLSAGISTGYENDGKDSSESEADALPHFGFCQNPLRGPSHEVELWSDVSSDGEDSPHYSDADDSHVPSHAGSDYEYCRDSDDVDRMIICDTRDSESEDHRNPAVDLDDNQARYKTGNEDDCDKTDIASVQDDDLEGYEADIEDSCDHPHNRLLVNYNGSDADIEDNCSA